MFFDNCDGIFINYTWKEDYPKKSVQIAEKRNLDVYTGIDIWGRNTFGGGGFDTWKVSNVVYKFKCIFYSSEEKPIRKKC